MIGKINSIPSFGSNVRLSGFGLDGDSNYKKIKMDLYKPHVVKETKKAIKYLRNNGMPEDVNINYDPRIGLMTLSVTRDLNGGKISGGPVSFMPNKYNLEKIYEGIAKKLDMIYAQEVI